MGSEAITIALSSALVGAAAGGLGALLMALISWGSQLGWGHAVTAGFSTTAPMAIRLTLPLLAGLAIGWLRRRGAAPLPELHTTLEELHEQGALKIQPRGSHLLLGLLALLGGGSLGPPSGPALLSLYYCASSIPQSPRGARSEADAVYRVMLLREVLEPQQTRAPFYTRPDPPGPSSAVAVPLYNGLLPSGPVRGVR